MLLNREYKTIREIQIAWDWKLFSEKKNAKKQRFIKYTKLRERRSALINRIEGI